MGASAWPLLRRCRRVLRNAFLAAFAIVVAMGTVGAGPVGSPDSSVLDVGDTELHLDVRGRGDAGTVLLFLHGGPGTAAGLLTFAAYPGPILERQHLVAYLHQRGVLRSPSVPDSALTIAAHIADVDHVVSHLRQRFPGRRVVLIGHSWGGLLAILYLESRPHTPVDGVVVLATPLSLSFNEMQRHHLVLDWAERTGNTAAILEMEALCPPPHSSVDSIALHRRWVDQAMPPTPFKPSDALIISAGGFDTVYPEWESTARYIFKTMFAELMAVDARPGLSRIRIPLLAISGGRDGIVLANATTASLEAYGGPRRFITFAASDHLLYMQEPQRLVQEITDFIAALPARRAE
jgi:pimeloyl-ACP methyl ester carboxylesterase